jgi:nucleotide-binding universal stress UspA family protein
MVRSARVEKIESRTVLIGADMSAHAPIVIREGLRMARLEHARAIVLHVVDDRFPYPDLFAVNNPDIDYFQTLRLSALAKIKEWAGSNAEVSPPELIVARGKPSSVILDVARERQPDLLVIGAHGLTGARHPHSLGATAERVARSSSVSVLIVVAGRE